jgi:hypothetical protein
MTTPPKVIPSPARTSSFTAGQWFALAAPPLVWSAHELSSMYLTFDRCAFGRPDAARSGLLVVTAIALSVDMAALTAGYWQLKALLAGRSWLELEGRSRGEMLALASVFLGLVFTVAIFWAALPAVLLRDVCEARQ